MSPSINLIASDLEHGVPNGGMANGIGSTVQSLSVRDDGSPAEAPLSTSDPEWALHEPQSNIDKRDADTPDRWVPRHPDLIRLTGRHPFNVEPPLPVLMQKGFITPPSLHYVRNHGPVPKIKWDEHRVIVNGLVGNPVSFSMEEMLQFPTTTVTCTLTCAGNRRKEQNMVKKSIGFNWGPAGTSCSSWTGVRLADILKHCGIKTPEEGANHVAFRGPKKELPQGEDGSYATSVPVYKAMDPGSDVILAYKQNGRLLTPDHGYPIRIIIPGYIGGRMVKWLEEISVQETESNNFYHFHDNRVLPSHVDEALAKKEGWWYKPDFIINDININSAIASPGHEEVVSFSGASTYTVKGYAYAGNGRKIIRCEVSVDDGLTWKLADIHRNEKPNVHGKHWCWVFYSIAVPLVELVRAKEIICRAWDECMNTQPNTFTWNLMGMLNNCVYRVRIHPTQTSLGGIGLRFEHPVLAGAQAGGWLNPIDPSEQVTEVVKAVLPADMAGMKTFTMEEVEKHDHKDSAWFVRDGKVYDATPFLAEHPGGADSILIVAGQDATDEFDAIHSAKAKAMLEKYCIGVIGDALPAANEYISGTWNPAKVEEAAAPVALDPKKRLKFKLMEKYAVSHDVTRFRFALPSPQHKFGLPCGKHVFIYAKIKGELVLRAYTPTSSDDDLGHFDLVIKVYKAGVHPRFPDGGKMSQYLEGMRVGDDLEVKGPVGHMHYTGNGGYTLDSVPQTAKFLSMVSGGTGITPIYQVVKAVLKNPLDTTKMRLVFANQTPEDILLREELDDMAKDPRFEVWYTVDRDAPEDWAFSTGFISEDMLRDHLFPSGPETVCLLCGPPPMIKFACLPNLEKLGYTPEQCIQF